MPKYVELSANVGLDMTAVLCTSKKLEIKVMSAEDAKRLREEREKDEK